MSLKVLQGARPAGQAAEEIKELNELSAKKAKGTLTKGSSFSESFKTQAFHWPVTICAGVHGQSHDLTELFRTGGKPRNCLSEGLLWGEEGSPGRHRWPSPPLARSCLAHLPSTCWVLGIKV